MEEPDDLQPIDDDETDDPGDGVGPGADDDELDEDDDDELDEDDDDELDEEDDDDELDEEEDDDEPEFATIGGGSTLGEARQAALDGLRKLVPYVSPTDVEYIVLDEGSKGGLFGRGKMEARVEARLRPSGDRADADLPPGAEKLREFVQRVVALMGVEARVSASETPEWVRAEIGGDDLGLLIGRHGATIDALQYIAAIVVNGGRRERRQVIVDAEGYRDRRAAALTALADRTAQKVAREGAAVVLKPMTAAERKVIHLHLKDHARVQTASEGNEPFRAVVVSPKQA
jgi:spoIIIJ-associated protein